MKMRENNPDSFQEIPMKTVSGSDRRIDWQKMLGTLFLTALFLMLSVHLNVAQAQDEKRTYGETFSSLAGSQGIGWSWTQYGDSECVIAGATIPDSVTSVVIPDKFHDTVSGVDRTVVGIISEREWKEGYSRYSDWVATESWAWEDSTPGFAKVREVTFPSTTRFIGTGAFVGRTDLKKVTVSNTSPLTIDTGAFYGSGLETLIVEGPVESVGKFLGDYEPGTTLREVAFKGDVGSIAWGAFYEQKTLTSVTFGGKLTEIPEQAFYNCTALISLNLPSSVTEIGREAFEYCSSLTGISSLPTSITKVGEFAFRGCRSLHMSVRHPGTDFSYQYKDSGITDITFSGDIEWFYPGGLTGCRDLKSITFEKKTESGLYTRDGILYTTRYYYDRDTGKKGEAIGEVLMKYPAAKNPGGTFEIPDWVTSIDGFAFDSCSLKTIRIPDNVHYYDLDSEMMASIYEGSDTPPSYYPFDNMTAQCRILYDKHLFDPYDGFAEDDQRRGFALSSSGQKLSHTWVAQDRGHAPKETETNPSGGDETAKTDVKGYTTIVSALKVKVTKAAGSKTGTVTVTGAAKTGVKTLKIPDTVKIGKKKYKVTAIGAKAFQKLTKLTKVTVGKYVTTIGANAFANCTALKSVTLGAGVTTLGKKVFYGDKKLTTIAIKSTKLKKVGAGTFKGIAAKAKIKVPSKKLTAYKKLLKGKGQGKKVTIVKG